MQQLKNTIIVGLAGSMLVGLTQLGFAQQPKPEPPLLRLGWQIPWATQGQIVQSLKHTNILDKHPLRVEFKGFSYGGPLNEAALAGEVDVILTADQPAATLLSRNPNWTIVGRMMYNRVALYVPPDSPIKTLTDLKGKKIAMPFGAAAQRDALKAIQQAGLDPEKDVRSVNLDIYEQKAIVEKGTRSDWGQVDALVGFDPTPAVFEVTGKARMLHVGQVVSLIVVANDFLKAHGDVMPDFLVAFLEAYLYFARHPQETGTWFQQESRLTFDPQVLDVCAAVEPNYQARKKEQISLTLSEKDLAIMQEGADFIFNHGLVKTHVEMRQHIELKYLNLAVKKWLESPDVEPAIRP